MKKWIGIFIILYKWIKIFIFNYIIFISHFINTKNRLKVTNSYYKIRDKRL